MSLAPTRQYSTITYDTDAPYDPERKKTQWQRFDHQVSQLNIQSADNVQYKILYIAYWSKLDGNDTVTWADAHLTDKGIQQAQIANNFWKAEITTQKIPVPQKYYTSPLHRCLATANITFSELELPDTQPFIPEVKEFLREVNGVHTCDRRSNKTYLHSEFPPYVFEPGFAENDELWSPDVRESDPDLDARLKKLLDDVFTHDSSTYISFTAHSGAISALLRDLWHRPFRLQTGGVIPVLVKAETFPASLSPTSIAA
ncbi:hypothetical protein OEA41_001848 [Lepraria neglecta]|uniref:Phosphoglycerate mutase-like protein n=1 Tax=Lepraria neglecta TaxID=209136 RepID=A0AAE0DLU6_9LECA|nr:hypothetical protein OEA41_001848 [Lepraria neglecta]